MYVWKEHEYTFDQIIRAHIDLVVKELFKDITKNKRDLERYNKTMMSGLCDGSMRYWRSQANGDKAIVYIQEGFNQLRILDQECNWSKKIDYPSYKFISKYPDVLNEYLSKFN